MHLHLTLEPYNQHPQPRHFSETYCQVASSLWRVHWQCVPLTHTAVRRFFLMIIYMSHTSYPNVSNYITVPCIVSLQWTLWKSIFSVPCENTPTWLIIVSFHKCWLPSQQPQIPHGHVTCSTTDPQPDLAVVDAWSGSFDLTGLQLSQTQRWGLPAPLLHARSSMDVFRKPGSYLYITAQ